MVRAAAVRALPIGVAMFLAFALTGCDTPRDQPASMATLVRAGATAGDSQSADVRSIAYSLMKQIEACWYIDPKLQPAGDLAVDIAVSMLQDGTISLLHADFQDRMTSDVAYRPFTQSAMRAIRKCSPYKLPQDKYETWKSLVITFEYVRRKTS